MTETLTVPSLAEILILDAWQVYRRSQQIPFPPNAGPVIKAQSRLWHHLEPFTRTSMRPADGEPDADAIDDAIDALVASVEWHCGAQAAAFVAGDDEGQVAA